MKDREPDPDSFKEQFKQLMGAIPEIKGAVITSLEGRPLASALSPNVDEALIASMTSVLFSISNGLNLEMDKGEFDQLYIKGSEGYLLILNAGPNAILMVSTTSEVRLGLILLDLRKKNGDGSPPFPYVFNPPRPPDDFGTAAQAHVIHAPKEDLDEGFYCKYCGNILPKGETICPSCKHKVP